ncbi:MAG: M24 family metallopeptidase, partial [Myxococcales bacterium]|nr:M24 family metallopeptidase [Myxococcales bacterium]
MPVSDRHREVLTAGLAELLRRAALDGWVVFTREASVDPVAPYVGAERAVARLACLFGRIDGALGRVAIAASYDTTPLEESGLYQKIVPYGSEGAKPHLREWLGRMQGSRIGIDASRDIPMADGLAAGMRGYLEESVGSEQARRFVSAERLVVDLVGSRSPEEVAVLSEAVLRTQRIARAALVSEHVRAGRSTERDLGAVMTRMTEAGGDVVEFLSINVGPTRGHSDPTDRIVAPGDVLRIDFGIRHRGFCSDIQRTAYVLAPGETAPPEAITRMWRVNREAYRAALAALRPGATGLDVDRAARAVVEGAGYAGYQHAAGHALGTRVHEIGPI